MSRNVSFNKDSSKFGVMVGRARVAQGYTARFLGGCLGVSQSYVSAVENGRVNMARKYIKPLAEVLGLDALELESAWLESGNDSMATHELTTSAVDESVTDNELLQDDCE